MELVEGEALRGPLPMKEALSIARQIVEALEAAHEKGITHRDLKPANIKITPDGVVKVLDFGLAKVAPPGADLENSPTISALATGGGVILGTPAYMAPEQARGQVVDKRADIWAFGVVLYELLTGNRLFTGDSTTDVLAGIVRAEPDWSALPESTPPAIRRLLKRCLQKDRKRRLPDIGVARLEIDEALAPPEVEDSPTTVAPRRAVVPWFIAAVVLTALAILAYSGFLAQSEPGAHWIATRLSESTAAMAPRISPDGQWLAFQAVVDGLTQVALMKPGTANSKVLTDDRSLGYIMNISWSLNGDKLYFDRYADAPGGVFSVPVLGGDEQLVVENAMSPQVLPDGSLLIERLNSNRLYQLYRFWPESRREVPLKALLPQPVETPTAFRVSPQSDRVAFLGKPLDRPDDPLHLFLLDLVSEKMTQLAPGVFIPSDQFVPFVVAPDGRSVFIALREGDAQRIVSVPMDGSNNLKTLMTLPSQVTSLDMDGSGSLYLDQRERPTEFLRVSPAGGTPIHVAAIAGNGSQALPLPDGRIVVDSVIGGRDRLLLMTPGKEPSSFETQEETSSPMTLVGQALAAIMIGPRTNRTIALASLSDGRIVRRIESSKGARIDSMATSTDGRTIYYAASGSIWSIPVDDGPPRKLRNGDSVTVDPYRQDLIIRITDKDGTRMVRSPIAGGDERPISLKGNMRWAPWRQSSNAVGKDGRILAILTSPASWFWPVGLVDPDTGSVQVVQVGYYADMGGGWTADGNLLITAAGLRSTLWRFSPATAAE
jgi:Tol biopolymer transport system component